MVKKLSFTDKAQWTSLRDTLITEPTTLKTSTCQLLAGGTITIVEVGYVPLEAVYDEETGENINEGLTHDDFAVDILTDVEIPEVEDYVVVDAPNKWRNHFMGL